MPVWRRQGPVLGVPRGAVVYWDATYLADRIAFIKAAGARYSGNTDVIAVTCGAVN